MPTNGNCKANSTQIANICSSALEVTYNQRDGDSSRVGCWFKQKAGKLILSLNSFCRYLHINLDLVGERNFS